ncbi:GspMb/PilO family protein [Undibacterium terreum]|nr:GspMb/PilO family protein [Undibacterium terreum]
MTFRFLRHGEFYVRRQLQLRPRFIVCLSVALAALVVTALAAAQVAFEHLNAEETIQEVIQQAKHRNQVIPSPSSISGTDLPRFDSAQLVEALHRVAEEVKLPADEISYALEGNENQAYLRYRVTLSVTASYPVIRKFAEHFQAQLPNVSLDSISCTRDDIAATALSCDLGLSAFYQKAVHG